MIELPPAPEDAPVAADFFGMTFYDNTNNSSSNNTPLTFSGSIGTIGKKPGERWVYIQPTSGASFDWAPIDDHVAIMERYGMTEFLYSIDNTPGWAVADHSVGTGATNAFTGEWESWLPPDNMQDYLDFVDALLTRYPQIRMLTPFTEPQNTPIPIATAVAMCSALTEFVHANYPGVLVGTPTVQPRGDGNTVGFWYYDFFAAYYADENNENFDVLVWHGYTRLSGSGTWTDAGGPNLELVNTRFTNSLQGALIENFPHLSYLPIWDDESSWGTDANATAWSIDRPAFVAQWLLMHMSWRSVVNVWYGPTGLSWGSLFQQNGSGGGILLPEGIAWKEMQFHMLGALLVGTIDLVDGFRVGFWTREDPADYEAYSVWRPDGAATDYTIPAGMAWARYIDGTFEAVTPGNTISIGSKPVWLESDFRS